MLETTKTIATELGSRALVLSIVATVALFAVSIVLFAGALGAAVAVFSPFSLRKVVSNV